MPASNPWQAGQKVGARRFTLIKQLGRGGMGVVWLAHDTQLDEPVALKFLPPEIASDSVSLNDLCRETVRSHKLTHPNIIRIHDFVQSEEAAFISMEYVDGSTLSDWRLQQPKQVLSWEQLAPLVQQLCAALEYAHGEGVIHRDLKPANLMVDKRNRLKLADFGIAAMVSDSVSRVSLHHSTSGTLPYMSPQQLTGKRPQATDDIYALGAALYELLTSKPPFYTGDVTHQVLHELPEPMEERLGALEIQNSVLAEVAALVMACLAKEPEQRPQSARAVAEWIGLELAPKPTTESLAAALFPATKTTPVEEVASAPAGPARVAAPAGLGRNLAAVAIVVLVMAGFFWFSRGSHQGDHSSPSVAAQVPVQTEPASELTLSASGASPQEPTSPAATQQDNNWITLFDGPSVDAWEGSHSSIFPSQSWKVENGALKNIPTGPKTALFTRQKFLDFELEFEWMVGYGGNSGVFYSAEQDGLCREFQLIDEDRAQFPEDHTGALWGAIAPSGDKRVQPCGEWNQGRLLVQGRHVEHWVNGRKVVEYELGSGELEQKIRRSPDNFFKTHVTPQFSQPGEVTIGLQTLRGEVSFRNIRLKRLASANPIK